MGWVSQTFSIPALLMWLFGPGPWETQLGLPGLEMCPTSPAPLIRMYWLCVPSLWCPALCREINLSW